MSTALERRNRLEEIGRAVVDVAYGIHTRLGPGLLESVYEVLMARGLTERGFHVERQKAITFEFDGIRFEESFRADLIVEGCVVVEIKCAEKNVFLYERQLLTYLKLLDCRLGYVLNFGMATVKEGIRRIVNKL